MKCTCNHDDYEPHRPGCALVKLKKKQMKQKYWPYNHVEKDSINPFLWECIFWSRLSQVPEAWKLCPICGAKRPKKDKSK